MHSYYEFGTIKFFNTDSGKKFGFIRPDKPREDGKDVFFHRNNACQIVEDMPGSLELQLETWVEREPHKGDRVVYGASDHAKGPAAFEWNYEDEWKKAQAKIATRPLPQWPLCRVVQAEKLSNKTLRQNILWEGYWPLMMELVGRNDFFSAFRIDPAEWYYYAWVEEQKVTGWDRTWNPLDPSLSPNDPEAIRKFSISDEHRQRVQRFELARLIEEGDLLCARLGVGRLRMIHPVFVTIVDEIGCVLVARFGNVEEAHKAFCRKITELQSAKEKGRELSNRACAELLDLPKELIDTSCCRMLLAGEYDPQGLVNWLRSE